MLVLSLVESNDGGVHPGVGYLAEITFILLFPRQQDSILASEHKETKNL